MIDYTNCDQLQESDTFTPIGTDKFSASFATKLDTKHYPGWKVQKNAPSNISTNLNYTETLCTLSLTLPNDLNPPVLFYYRLTNFYQNHRKYVQSLDLNQLKGDVRTKDQLAACAPLQNDAAGRPYYPCGTIANSFFNDSFVEPLNTNPAGSSSSEGETYHMARTNIAWPADVKRFGKTKYKPSDVVPPPYWQDKFPAGYNDTNMPDLSEDQALMVWMRTAGLPAFDKLVMQNDSSKMQVGNYEIKIYSRFPSRAYTGTKSIVISTKNVMGSKNPVLGICYIVVGALSVLLGAVFTARHLIKPRYVLPHALLLLPTNYHCYRKLGDHTYLSWNDEDNLSGQAQAASAPVVTGRELPRDH